MKNNPGFGSNGEGHLPAKERKCFYGSWLQYSIIIFNPHLNPIHIY